MIRHFLFTFTNGIQHFYIFVATQYSSDARGQAWTAVTMKVESPSQVGLQYVKELREANEFDVLVKNNEHYNLNFEQIDKFLNNDEEGVSIGEWVKD
jgi:hypothetical protein